MKPSGGSTALWKRSTGYGLQGFSEIVRLRSRWNNLLRKLWNMMLRIKWNEINPHAPQRISHCKAIFHTRSVFHKSHKEFISLKKTVTLVSKLRSFSGTSHRKRYHLNQVIFIEGVSCPSSSWLSVKSSLYLFALSSQHNSNNEQNGNYTRQNSK